MARRPKLVATFGIRYEPQWLVDDLIANLSPWVDDFAIIDDRDRDPGELWGHEGAYRRRQRALAQKMGADWILVTCPDERFDDTAGDTVRAKIERFRYAKVIYDFELREMWTPTQWRCDGEWGTKRRRRLYPLLPDQIMADKPIHSGSVPKNKDYKRSSLDAIIYHLKHIEPGNRVRRAEVFKTLDPDYQYQKRQLGLGGWEHLTDEAGLQLADIEPGRGFSPPHTRRYIWAPPGFPATEVAAAGQPGLAAMFGVAAAVLGDGPAEPAPPADVADGTTPAEGGEPAVDAAPEPPAAGEPAAEHDGMPVAVVEVDEPLTAEDAKAVAAAVTVTPRAPRKPRQPRKATAVKPAAGE
jgi:hypothetical protein